MRGRVPQGSTAGFGRRAAQYPHKALDDVIDVGEVSPHPALVEYLNRFTRKDLPGEEHRRHVRAAPRTVYREKSKSCAWDGEQMRVGMGHQLVGFLGCGIETDG